MFTLNCRGKLLMVDKPLVMGIINVTPDSFFAESRAQTNNTILLQAEKMISEGADIIDIGGQSTRPGSERISADDEVHRVLPAIEIIINKFPGTIISVDTYQSLVAKECINAGASIINDISAGNLDNSMLATVASLQVPYICMHMKHTPETMQNNPVYENVTREVLDFFIEKTHECKVAGINDVIIDPGFGFAKTITHNFQLLKNLSAFKMLDKPILAGLSRKSTIYKTLGIPVKEALNGSTVLHTLALQNGANILRVHDVKEAREAVVLFQKYSEAP
ncbi:MAG: dihydropteroate synthase [Chitinophagaceae bacterium]|nr:dihydropteroate synthase [Chitinophagaceae bacterium]